MIISEQSPLLLFLVYPDPIDSHALRESRIVNPVDSTPGTADSHVQDKKERMVKGPQVVILDTVSQVRIDIHVCQTCIYIKFYRICRPVHTVSVESLAGSRHGKPVACTRTLTMNRGKGCIGSIAYRLHNIELSVKGPLNRLYRALRPERRPYPPAFR